MGSLPYLGLIKNKKKSPKKGSPRKCTGEQSAKILILTNDQEATHTDMGMRIPIGVYCNLSKLMFLMLQINVKQALICPLNFQGFEQIL